MKRNTKLRLFEISAFIIGIGILLLLIYHVGFERFFGIITQASPHWIVVSVIVYAASWLFRTWRLERFTTHAGKKLQIFELFKLYISGYALNIILPAKFGDVATVGYLKMKGINIGRSAAIIFQTRILDLLALILLSIPALILSFHRDVPSWITTAVFFSIFVVVVPFGIAATDKKQIFPNLFEKLVNKIRHKSLKLVMEKLKKAYESYHEIVRDKKLMVASLFLSVMIWLFDGLTCYAVAIAVGTKIPLVGIILAVCIANVGKSAPATPGGVGIYESILAAILVLLGVSFDVAIVIAILDHVIKKIFNLMFGLPFTASLGFNMAKIYQLSGEIKGSVE